jgi:hypothetical protein
MERIHQIMSEERAATLSYIERLDYPGEIKPDIRAAFAAVQDAVNAWIAKEDHVMDQRVIPMALALMHEELERIYKRLQSEGIAPLSHKLQ